MIEAYFTLSDTTKVPVLLPNDEILNIAATVGLSINDLFSIDIPSGASRHTVIKCLISQASIALLYASSSEYGAASATFSWRESSLLGLQTIQVTLLPPRPLYITPVPDGVEGGVAAGVCVVEAVDVRYWWKRTISSDRFLDIISGPMFSSDGRWNAGGVAYDSEVLPLLVSLKNALPIGSFNTEGFTPHPSLISRVADYRFSPDCSLAMSIDLVLSSTGYLLVWNQADGTGYSLVTIDNNTSAIGSWMTSTKRAYAGGVEPTSGSASSADPLMTAWNQTGTAQVNRMPSEVCVSFPYRTIEANTRYNNDKGPVTTANLQFVDQCEFGNQKTVLTTRARKINETVVLLREPRSLAAPSTILFNPYASSQTLETVPYGWDYDSYKTKVTALLAKRCSLNFGKVAYMGWPIPPIGAYHGTMKRYGFAVRPYRSTQTDEQTTRVDTVELLPVMTTECAEDDWIFGPSGLPLNDPEDLTISKGLIQARRLSNGVTQLDVAPPNTRIFPAKIVSAERIGNSGDDYWRWMYYFVEVEPNPAGNNPLAVAIAPFGRTSNNARNLMEAGNHYVSDGHIDNVIAAGVRQDFISEGVIDAKEICADSVVMMCEQWITATTEDGPHPVEYWFSVPNAVQIVCNDV